MREELLHKVGDRTGISYQSLKRDLESGNVTVQTEKPQVVVENKAVKLDGLSLAERSVLWAYLNDKDYAGEKDLSLIYFSDKTREKIAEHVLFEGGDIKSKLYSIVGEEGVLELNAVLSAGDVIPNKEQEKRYFDDCYKVVYKSNLEKDLKNLSELYKAEFDVNEKSKLALMIAQKTKELSKI